MITASGNAQHNRLPPKARLGTPLGISRTADFTGFRKLAAVFAAAVLLGCGSQAVAATNFTITFLGNVSTGSDSSNIFGLGNGANLAGQDITETYVVDYGVFNHDVGSAWDRNSTGGKGFISSNVTINGISHTIGSDVGFDERDNQHLNPNCPGCSESSFSVYASDVKFSNNGLLFETWDIDGALFGQSYFYQPSLALGPPVFTAADLLELLGSFQITHIIHNQTTGIDELNDLSYAKFTARSVTITDNSVPEPAVWALMLTGFGLTGSAMRRRSRRMITVSA